MRILFIHEGLGQFQTLHEHLNSEGLAHSWFLAPLASITPTRTRSPTSYRSP